MTTEAGPPDPAEDAGEEDGSTHRSRAGVRASWRRRKAMTDGGESGKQRPATTPANLPARSSREATGDAAVPAPAETPTAKGPPPPARPRPVMPVGGANENRRAAPSRAAAAAAAAALDAPLVPEEEEPDPLGLALGVLFRVVSVGWLIGAVWMWGRLVGYLDDTIDPAWHAPGGPWLTTLTAAVVYPVVAVGLWLRGRWGILLWGAAVAAEVTLLVLAPHLIPFGVLVLAANLVLLAAAGVLGAMRALSRADDD